MKKAIVWLFASKKRGAAVIAVLLALFAPMASKLGVELTSQQVELAVHALVGFIVGQGIADFGKSAKAIEAAGAKAESAPDA